MGSQCKPFAKDTATLSSAIQAETQDRGERDPELCGRDVTVEVLYRAARTSLSLPIALPHHRLDTGPPGPHQGELGRHEECIRDYQDHHRQRPQDDRSRF